MAEIRVLDSTTIDKIAAGEVVDRPASVVKELVENAIDAGADAVTVEIKEGGISFIRVTDNGSGIAKEQIPKAFLRHATSKIQSVEDLLTVSSLGFRGEALSSIAAVSQVEVITKCPDALTGVRYCIEGAKETGLEEVGAPDGTTFLVRNLFFNVPARRKFLKTAMTEGGYITELMEHLAMSKPAVSFKYIMNHQTKFQTSGNGDLKEVIYRIYGKDIAREVIPISVAQNDIILEGYIGKPAINRSNRNYENYFVNHRYIKSDFINKSIEEGYKTFMMQHKYPFCVLHFTMDSDIIDVNVHPNKMDIRFHNQSMVYDTIVNAVKGTLSGTSLIQRASLSEEKEPALPKKGTKESGPEPFEINRIKNTEDAIQEEYCKSRIKDNILEEYYTMPTEQESAPDREKADENPVPDAAEIPTFHKVIGQMAAVPKDSPVSQNLSGNVIKQKEHIIVEKPVQLDFFGEQLLSEAVQERYQILGQIFDTYWLIGFPEKLFIVDQHAAHEKVKYENIIQKIKNNQIISQQLNPPLIVTLSGKEEAVLQENMEYFTAMGFEIEAFGGEEYALRSVPTELFGCDEKQLFLEVLDEMTGSASVLKGHPEVVLHKIASMSCKAAVKGNTSMTKDEMQALIDQLLTLDNPYQCPHGRPTIIAMSKYEIEKKFKRIV